MEIKVTGQPLHVIHWDYNGENLKDATKQDLYIETIKGKGETTGTFVLKLKWVHRLYKDKIVFLSYIAENTFDIPEIRSVNVDDFKKLISLSFSIVKYDLERRIKEQGKDANLNFSLGMDILKNTLEHLQSES